MKGCESFEAVCTVDGVMYATFKEACYALSLLDDDQEWNNCIRESSQWAVGYQIRHLFVMILLHCNVANAHALWESNVHFLTDGILHFHRNGVDYPGLQLSDAQLRNYTLVNIDNILRSMVKSLREIPGMPLLVQNARIDVPNRLIHEETNFYVDLMANQHAYMHSRLNICQRDAYDAIVTSVTNDLGSLIFVQGHGDTGKTYIWKTIIAKLRYERKIVLAVATSGITALLLPNGRTSHSRFCIPLDIDARSTYEIKHKTHLSELICKTALIICDEAPMANRFCFEALDRTLRDILRDKFANALDRPFGGFTVVLGGDFRQILPVIHKSKRSDTVNAAFNSSYLWDHVAVYHLKTNMRLNFVNAAGTDLQDILDFDKWFLEIGDSSFFHEPKNELVRLPEDLRVQSPDKNLTCILDHVYSDVEHNYNMLVT